MATTVRYLNVEEELKEIAEAEAAVKIKERERVAIIANLDAEGQCQSSPMIATMYYD
jgi:hypothetical protein